MGPNRKRIFVVAGSHREYLEVIQKKRAEFFSEPLVTEEIFPEYLYVSHVDILRGRSEIEGFYCGTYWSRPDIEDIKFAIDTIKSRMKLHGRNNYLYSFGSC